MELEKENPWVIIYEIAMGGDGVGRLPNGKIIFVPRAMPGETVEVNITRSYKDYARGELIRIENPSPARRIPTCPLAASGECGGCPLMHIDNAQQQQIKMLWVHRALRDFAIPIAPILCPTPLLQYRIRARFVLRQGHLGYQATRSHKVTSIIHCPVLVPALDTAMQQVGHRLKAYLGENGELAGLLGENNQIIITVTPGKAANKNKLCQELQDLIKESVIVGGKIGTDSFGVSTVNLGSAKEPFWASADAFAQASRAGHDVLPHLIAQAVLWNSQENALLEWLPFPHRSDKFITKFNPAYSRLLELYAGAGNLTRRLLSCAEQVIAVEEHPQAAARLQQLAQGTAKLIVEQGAVENILPRLSQNGQVINAIVLDPPRSGAKFIDSDLLKLRAERIIYLSCNPMALARDLKPLLENDYKALLVQPIDLFPQDCARGSHGDFG